MRYWKYMLAIAGILYILLAVVVTPDFAIKYLSSDHQVTARGLIKLRAYRINSLCVGGTLLVVLLLSQIWGVRFSMLLKQTANRLTTLVDRLRYMLSSASYLIVFISALAVVSVLLATNQGIGISPDSVSYIGSARNYLKGEGLVTRTSDGVRPLTHWPPLYPILLIALGSLHVNPLDGARGLNTLLFGANILATSFLVGQCCRKSFWAPLVAAVLFFSFQPMLGIHSMAWTEPLFCFLGMCGFYFLAKYLCELRVRYLISSSVLIGLAFLARYLGIAMIVSGVLGILFLKRGRCIQRRMVDGAIFGGISLAPMMMWIGRNFLTVGSATDRQMQMHVIGLSKIAGAVQTVFSWVLPLGRSPIGALLSAIAISVLGFLLLYNESQLELVSIRKAISDYPLLGLLIMFILIYALALLMSIPLIDAHTPLDNRILSPVWISLLVLLLSLGTSHLDSTHLQKGGLFLACSIFALSQFVNSGNWLIPTYIEGQGYTSKAWKTSETLGNLQRLPMDTLIFTNGTDVVRFYTDRPFASVPFKYSPGTKEINENYAEQLLLMGEKIAEENAVLVYFDAIRRSYLPELEELLSELSLVPLVIADDGAIYHSTHAEAGQKGVHGWSNEGFDVIPQKTQNEAICNCVSVQRSEHHTGNALW